MPTVLMSVRLSPELAAMVDRASERLECSPSGLVEALLERSEPRREDIVQWAAQGPLTEKRNLRLAPEAVRRLDDLAGTTIEPSGFIRQTLGYFLSTPEWHPLLADTGNGDTGAEPKPASGSRRSRGATPRQVHGQPQSSLLAGLASFFLALLLPLVILAVQGLTGWLRRPGEPGTHTAPEDDSGPPPFLSSP